MISPLAIQKGEEMAEGESLSIQQMKIERGTADVEETVALRTKRGDSEGIDEMEGETKTIDDMRFEAAAVGEMGFDVAMARRADGQRTAEREMEPAGERAAVMVREPELVGGRAKSGVEPIPDPVSSMHVLLLQDSECRHLWSL